MMLFKQELLTAHSAHFRTPACSWQYNSTFGDFIPKQAYVLALVQKMQCKDKMPSCGKKSTLRTSIQMGLKLEEDQ